MTSRSSLFRTGAVAALLAVIVVILYESSQEHGSPGILDLTTNQAYLGHFAIYAVLAFCALAVLGRPTVLGLAGVLVLALALGIGMELYQAHVPTRAPSAEDALADGAGAAFGLFAYTLLSMLWGASETQPTKL